MLVVVRFQNGQSFQPLLTATAQQAAACPATGWWLLSHPRLETTLPRPLSLRGPSPSGWQEPRLANGFADAQPQAYLLSRN